MEDRQPGEPAPRDLSDLVEANLFALFRAMATVPGGTLRQGPNLARHAAPPMSPMFTGVWGARLGPGEVDRAIADTLAELAAAEVPFAFWWTGPSTRPADLGRRLEAHGLEPLEVDAPGMVATIADLDLAALERAPAGLEITPARDDADLEDFVEAFARGYEMPDWAARAWAEATAAAGLERAPWRIHVGRLDGRPVASAIAVPGGGAVGLYGVATVPEARGRGIGAAMTLAPLVEAAAAGHRHAALFSSDMGLPLYRRLGFTEPGVSISRYLWLGPAGEALFAELEE
jgi:GNAT superfamily N-acetyltransferase